MKRILKFRVWDTHLETYTYDAHVYHEFIKWLSDERYIIEQFTGYTDRKKTDIYEGDILGRVYVTQKGYHEQMVVKFHSPGDVNISPSAYLMDCEVIGNKHQAGDIVALY